MTKQLDRYIAAIQHDNDMELRLRITGHDNVCLMHLESWHRSRRTGEFSETREIGAFTIDQALSLSALLQTVVDQTTVDAIKQEEDG